MRGLTPPRKEDLNLLCLSLVYIWNSASKSIAFMVQNDRSFPVLAFRQDFLQLIHLRSWPGHHVCHTTHERMTARYCATRVSVAGIRLVSLLNQQTCLTASWSNTTARHNKDGKHSSLANGRHRHGRCAIGSLTLRALCLSIFVTFSL